MVGHVTGGDSTVLYVGFFSFLIKQKILVKKNILRVFFYSKFL